MVHLVERVHGRNNLSAGHLLVERVDEAVGTCAIVTSNGEGVEVRIQSVCLGAEGQTSGHAELRKRKKETLTQDTGSTYSLNTVFLHCC